MDEKTIILEQERQEKAKKRKKYKKLKWTATGLVCVLCIGGIWYAGWGRTLLTTEEEETVKIVSGAGQEVVYARITAINGNEITYAVAEVRENSQQGGSEEKGDGQGGRGDRQQGGKQEMSGDMGEMPDMGDMSGEMPDMSSMPDMGDMSGEMPDMSGMSGEMPDMSGFSGEMPDMSNMPDMGGMSGGRGQMGGGDFSSQSGRGSTSSTTESQNTLTYEDCVYVAGEETLTQYIPVGTEVTTKLGTVTTFSRLSAGDWVALVVEDDVIMAVYIIG